MKDWVREGVVLPVRGKEGPGRHATYDAANLVAVVVARELRDLGVVPKRIRARFAELHRTLRGRSSLGWRGARIMITRDDVVFDDVGQSVRDIGAVALVIDLDEMSRSLLPVDSDPQMSLHFGVSAVN